VTPYEHYRVAEETLDDVARTLDGDPTALSNDDREAVTAALRFSIQYAQAHATLALFGQVNHRAAGYGDSS
jgi:hypothetical protein